ncbi:hypothetical protein APR11_002374 [Nocardia amikacinitolerans]|uniref:hypothetical protein n=1 Tax=Nocardia amikacinitolerans TaxID=756689 RepID=UPI0020A2DE3C|nr:hypothetical protein [Nocardia amikacinitolerans]MCP2295946.1 hypothetical protein [Nocardia amikacinitolerans]
MLFGVVPGWPVVGVPAGVDAGASVRWLGADRSAAFGVVPVGWAAFVGVAGVPGVRVSAGDVLGDAGFGEVPGRWVGWLCGLVFRVGAAGWFEVVPGWAVVGVLGAVAAGVLSPGRGVSMGVDAGNAGNGGVAVAVAEAVLVSVDTGLGGFGVVGLVGVGSVGFGVVGAEGAGVPVVVGAGVVGALEVGAPVVPGGVAVVLSGFDAVGVDGVVAGFDGVVATEVDGVDGPPFAGVDGVDGVRSSVVRDGSWGGVVPGTPEVGVVGLLGADGVVGWVGTEPAGVLEVGLFSRPDWSEVSGAGCCVDGSLPVEGSVVVPVGLGVVGGESGG